MVTSPRRHRWQQVQHRMFRDHRNKWKDSDQWTKRVIPSKVQCHETGLFEERSVKSMQNFTQCTVRYANAAHENRLQAENKRIDDESPKVIFAIVLIDFSTSPCPPNYRCCLSTHTAVSCRRMIGGIRRRLVFHKLHPDCRDWIR
jgi:hypothetical protein